MNFARTLLVFAIALPAAATAQTDPIETAPVPATAPVPTAEEPAPAPAPEPEEEPEPILNLNEAYSDAVSDAQRGRNTRAIERFKAIARQDPYWSDVFYNVGSISEHIGHHQDCALYFRRYLMLEPDDPDADDITRSINRCEGAMPASGTLAVTATAPEGADILIDGVPLGEGSLDAIPLEPGTYTVTATLIDHHDARQVVEITDGGAENLTITLYPIPYYGSVVFEVVQDGATIRIDGQEIGTSPLAEPVRLETGEYAVEVIKEGYHPWRRNIDILRDLEDLVEVRLIDESIDLSQYGR